MLNPCKCPAYTWYDLFTHHGSHIKQARMLGTSDCLILILSGNQNPADHLTFLIDIRPFLIDSDDPNDELY
uniref:Uncharacterized protein n=1 Tax=Megaselia scalaris TaxID=36166 RepID=T1GL52_MEGSC